MSKLRNLDTRFWSDPYIRKQKPNGKLLFAYFLTNEHTNIAGCYEITVSDIALETQIDRAEIAQLIRNFALKKRITYKNEWLLIHNFLDYEPLNPKKIRGIELLAEKMPDWAKRYVIDRLSLVRTRAESDLNPEREEEEERERNKDSLPTLSQKTKNPEPRSEPLTDVEVKELTKQLGRASGFADMFAVAFPEMRPATGSIGFLEAKGYQDTDLVDNLALVQTFLRYREFYDAGRGSYDPRKASTFASVWLEERGKLSNGGTNGTGNGQGRGPRSGGSNPQTGVTPEATKTLAGIRRRIAGAGKD